MNLYLNQKSFHSDGLIEENVVPADRSYGLDNFGVLPGFREIAHQAAQLFSGIRRSGRARDNYIHEKFETDAS